MSWCIGSEMHRSAMLGQELSGVPVDARVSHGDAQANSMQQQMKQEYLIAKPDAQTTTPNGV